MDKAFNIVGNRLYKAEKLCSAVAESRLFESGHSFIAYPLRVVWAERQRPKPGSQVAQFLISVPKRRIRHAVQRVLLRRRVREAYRLNRSILLPELERMDKRVDIAFVYVSSTVAPYDKIQEMMQQSLQRIVQQLNTIADESIVP